MKTNINQIHYLQRGQIDAAKWDRCIEQAGNGLLYGYSFYLDAMAGAWDALVLNDYSMVMPLPWRRKGGIRYLYQPFLTAQLGVFGNELSAGQVALFLRSVPQTFRYWDFPLNHQNFFAVEGFPLFQRMNYVLPLTTPYETLFRGYRENIRRNIKKSGGYGCTVVRDVSIADVFALTRFQAKDLTQKDVDAFEGLFQLLQKKGLGKIYGVRSAKGELLAAAAFLFSHSRAYYLLVGNHPNGRTLGASHALVDAFIRDHAGKNLVLDFEGSDIRNLAFFYSSFGAREEPYASIRLNRLPRWLKWLK